MSLEKRTAREKCLPLKAALLGRKKGFPEHSLWGFITVRGWKKKKKLSSEQPGKARLDKIHLYLRPCAALKDSHGWHEGNQERISRVDRLQLVGLDARCINVTLPPPSRLLPPPPTTKTRRIVLGERNSQDGRQSCTAG